MQPRPKFGSNYSQLILNTLSSYDVHDDGDGDYRARCPHMSGSKNRRGFRINKRGSWICYTCGARGDIIALLMQVNHLSFKQAKDLAGDESSHTRMLDVSLLPPIPSYEERFSPPPYTYLRDASIAVFTEVLPVYLLQRGFSASVLRKYEIGYDEQRHKIVIPVRDVNKRIVGLTYRIDYDRDKEQPSKYWHDNLDKAAHLYGLHMWVGVRRRVMCVTEGQLDTCRLHQLGLASVGIMGSDISSKQVALLVKYAKVDRIVLAFDNDDPGRAATRRAIKAFSGTRFINNLGVLSYPGKDPGDLQAGARLTMKPWYDYLLKKGGIYDRGKA